MHRHGVQNADKIPSTLLAKVRRLLGICKRQWRGALVRVRIARPSHERVQPLFRSDTVLVEINFPARFGVQGSLTHRLFLLANHDGALAAINMVTMALVDWIERRNFRRVLWQNGSRQGLVIRLAPHHVAVVFRHVFNLFRDGIDDNFRVGGASGGGGLGGEAPSRRKEAREAKRRAG